MQVETYEVTEDTTQGKEADTDPAALRLIEELGLEGQLEFSQKRMSRHTDVPWIQHNGHSLSRFSGRSKANTIL